jgi:hypothetical protein
MAGAVVPTTTAVLTANLLSVPAKESPLTTLAAVPIIISVQAPSPAVRNMASVVALPTIAGLDANPGSGRAEEEHHHRLLPLLLLPLHPHPRDQPQRLQTPLQISLGRSSATFPTA